ncbi:hypothetical protein MKW98_012951, partial [Papaver atlanticum]
FLKNPKSSISFHFEAHSHFPERRTESCILHRQTCLKFEVKTIGKSLDSPQCVTML